jgi:hypothetical protein
MFYERLFEELDGQKIKYVLAGGMAVVLHGVPRLTMDIDLIVHLENENLEKFLKIVTKLGYKPKVPVDPMDFADPNKRKVWIEKKNMLVFNFYHPTDPRDQVDIFVKEPFSFQTLWAQRKVGRLGPIKVHLAAISHIIRMKEKAGREQDLSDIVQLKRLQLKLKQQNEANKKEKERV